MNVLFRNATILPMTAKEGEPQLVEGSLAVEDRKIAYVAGDEARDEEFLKTHKEVKVVDCRGNLLMPGLINTHCHAAMTLQRSMADDISLMEWLNDHIWPFEAVQTPEEIQVGMRLGIAEMLLGGITSFVDMYHYEHRCVDVVDQMGIRALLSCNFFDANIDRVEGEILEANRLAEGKDCIAIGVAAHAPYSCNRENILRGKALARKLGMKFIIHVAETKDETRTIEEQWGMSPVKYLDSLGVLDEDTIAAHCIYVDDEDIDILVKRGVNISHNPQSNMKISSGVAPVAKQLAAGGWVTIATDGTCSNNDLDLFEEMRSASFLQKVTTGSPTVLPAYEVLKMVTVNGARAMGYKEGELGVLKEGALADLIMIDLRKPHLQPIHNLVSNIVYCCKASDVDLVMVGGRILVEHRELLGVDLNELYDDANRAVQRIMHDWKK